MPLTATNDDSLLQLLAKLQAHQAAVRDNWIAVAAIKEGIAVHDKDNTHSGALSWAAEAWFELDNDTKRALWLPPRDGGIFTAHERTVIKSSEFRIAHYGG